MSLELGARGLLHDLRLLYAENGGPLRESYARTRLGAPLGAAGQTLGNHSRAFRRHLEALNRAGFVQVLASKPLTPETETEKERTTAGEPTEEPTATSSPKTAFAEGFGNLHEPLIALVEDHGYGLRGAVLDLLRSLTDRDAGTEGVVWGLVRKHRLAEGDIRSRDRGRAGPWRPVTDEGRDSRIEEGEGSRVKETDLTRTILDAARTFGWSVTHFRPALTRHGWRTPLEGDAGFPDLVLARQGRVLAVELKSATGRLRPNQEFWRDQLGAGERAVLTWRLVRPDSSLDEFLAELSRHPGDTLEAEILAAFPGASRVEDGGGWTTVHRGRLGALQSRDMPPDDGLTQDEA